MGSFEERASMSMVLSQAPSLNYFDTPSWELLESTSIRKIPYKFLKNTSKALKVTKPRRKSKSEVPVRFIKYAKT